MDIIAGISDTTLKNLSDRSIERRKQAAMELQGIIEELIAKKKEVEIKKKIEGFTLFTEDDNAQRRKTGLYGLSVISVALYQKKSAE